MGERLGLPVGLLAHTGEFFLLYGAAATLALLLVGGLSPTLLGKGYVVVQALTVAVLAELQYFGLRRSGGWGWQPWYQARTQRFWQPGCCSPGGHQVRQRHPIQHGKVGMHGF